jgi:putative ABC transport system substrate-binding protein
MRRRDFINVIVGSAAAWPLAASAQPTEHMRHVVALTGVSDQPNVQRRFIAFRQAMQKLGWTEGRNLHIDYRWGGGSPANTRKHARELAAMAPDVILATGGASVELLLQATRTVPIVFVIVPDPVGSGYVESLSQPSGNATGFMQFEYNLCGKWLELLKEITPNLKRAAVLRDPSVVVGIGQFAVIQSVAPMVGIEVRPINLRDAKEIERAIGMFARLGNGGLILTASPRSVFHHRLIIELAAKHRLPVVYNASDAVTKGGLISYGADFIDQYRLAAGYVDRILKGEKPGDMPVQVPTKYELVINLRTAKALGITMPSAVLARADRVIE